jgi:Flp pilus assembly protein TadG
MSGLLSRARRRQPPSLTPRLTGKVRREGGAVIVTVAMSLLFLLGFMALAMDVGHLFVVKTELQTAADSCALAAAQELDGGSDALTRATNAGVTVGNRNNVNFQGASASFVAADITFSDSLTGSYSQTFTPVANAKYAKCAQTKSGMAPWLLQNMTAVTGNASFSANQSVLALGVATRVSAQSVCNALPVQIRPKAGGTAPNYGYAPGEWISALYNEAGPTSATTPGHFGWGNLDGSTNAAETKAELLGFGRCNLRVGDAIGTPGVESGASTAWNSRFGLYKNGAGNPQVTNTPPDLTGYAYTATNWPSRRNAVGDFLAKRAANWSYGGIVDTRASGNAITGLSLPGAYNNNNMATHAAGPRALATFGVNRRLVLAPIVAGGTITDWACVLMLHPMDGPTVTVYLEFVGNASAPSSPCANPGLAGGGTTGPLVPALVQ